MEKGLMPAFLDLPCALLVTDPSGRLLALNDELLAVLGGTRVYWETAGLDAMLPPASRVFLQTHVWPMLLHLGRVRELALALPEVEERPSHGSPGWRVGGKYFAHFNDQHHGAAHIALLAKTSGADELDGLVESQPHAYFRPAYYGASGWVGIILNRPGVDWDAVAEWLERSWRGAAPKRLTRLMDIADAF